MRQRGRSTWSIAGQMVASLVTSAPAGAVIAGVGNMAVTVWRLIPGAYKGYRAFWRTKQIGPVLKTTASIASLVGVVVIPASALIVSSAIGLGYGFYYGVETTIPEGVKKSAKLVARYDELIQDEVFVKLDAYEPEPLEEGEEPVDIRIPEMIRGLCAAFTAGPLEALGLTGVVLLNWFPCVGTVYRGIWGGQISFSVLELTARVCGSVLAAPLVVAAIPLTPITALLFSVTDACVAGYKEGMWASFKGVGKRMQKLHQALRNFAKLKT